MDVVRKTPWEQHASAAGLPRFNYRALCSADTLKGFLITCALDREKSATKEAMAILSKHLESSNLPESSGSTEVLDADESVKPYEKKLKGRLVSNTGKIEQECTHIWETEGQDAGVNGEGCTLPTSPSDSKHAADNNDAVNMKRSRAEFENSKTQEGSSIFLLKMAQKGIISIFWECNRPYDPAYLLSQIIADVENGTLSPLRWCQRMVPVQASCVYSRDSLSALVTKLVKEYLGKSRPTEMQPLKFAVSFNRRGFQAREVIGLGDAQYDGLDRMSCIHLVTAAVTAVTPHMSVDLTAPEMVVIVEVMPLARVQGLPICGVAVLSGTLMNTKPRLAVKSLVPGTGQ